MLLRVSSQCERADQTRFASWLQGRVFVVCALLAVLAGSAFGASVTLHGRVVNEDGAPVAGANVRMRPASEPASAGTAESDPTGAFTITLPAPGDYLITVERDGFYPLKDRALHIQGAEELTLSVATVREVFQSENVNAETSPVDVGQTHNEEQLTGTEVNNIPYASSHSLRNALSLLPGVVADSNGLLHVNGSQENQVQYLLNGFDVTNPITGQLQTGLAVEGIRSIDLNSGRYSPEFGKGSGGVLSIHTENGTDAFHYTATDFIPGLDLRHGLHLGNWYPRVGISGPIVRGRAWFSDTFDFEYNQSVFTGLPHGQDTRSGWAGNNLLHTQLNLTPANIVFADFLANISDQGRQGLGALAPVSTTTTMRAREYLANIKDQQYFGHGMLVEFGFAHTSFSNAQVPQGTGLYILTPTGMSGNYFVNSRQSAVRDQGLVHAYLAKFHLAGTHQVEAGTDLDWLHYNGNFIRTGYQVLGESGQVISQTLFGNAARFGVGDREATVYVLDTWRIAEGLQVVAGVREDWDRAIGASAASPRAAFSWAPLGLSRTRIAGGYAITHDAVTMGMLGLPLDQTAYTTQYNSSGGSLGPAALTTFAIPGALSLPRATNWTLNVDHQLTDRVHVSANYLRRRGSDGFVFVNTLAPDALPSLLPLPSGTVGGVYQLTNLRRDDFDSVQFAARQKFSGQFEWMASYTWSRALSNALLDPNTPQPLQVLSYFAPMPWDAPHRFLGWTYLPLPWKNWAVSALADLRSGFPFSVRDQSGVVVAAVDSYHYPVNFNLNLAIERMLTLRGYRFALRGGVDNLTNQANPTAVNNVTGVPQYLKFFGEEGRHFVVRIRFFGRV